MDTFGYVLDISIKTIKDESKTRVYRRGFSADHEAVEYS